VKFPRIAHKIYSEPWLIKPSQHASIRRAFESALNRDTLTEAAFEVKQEDTPALRGAVAVVPVFGVIGKYLSTLETACGGCDLNAVASGLDLALADESVQQIILHINSPGGTVTGTPELANRIAAAAKLKPIIAFTDTQCCSAAYWLASQCSAVFAAPSAEVGSIGVYMALLDESAALEKEGVKVNVIKAGKYKTAGAPFQALTDEERAMFQKDVDAIYAKFTAAIRATRPGVTTETMQGQTFSGEDAVEAGLTDGTLDTLEECFELLAR
jgi:protease-4